MIYLVGGTRPNFMKIAALSRAFDNNDIEYEIIHTGQHYDYFLDEVFFKQFELKDPLFHMNVKSGPHGEQTARILERFENICARKNPDLVFVVGDVNSTMACALAASKLHIPIAHQEAGMRSYDKKMPEEINRVVTDHISDFLFPISKIDRDNLYRENITKNVFLVGDVMIDNLLYFSENNNTTIIPKKPYILVELHRPSNVDNKETLEQILNALHMLTFKYTVVFTIHPRTLKMINEFNLWDLLIDVKCKESLGYFEFINYMKNADCILTDSDGIQQETSILNIPCVAIRDTCNIPYTITNGTNILVDPDRWKIIESIDKQILNPKENKYSDDIMSLNDGNASERICKVLIEKFFK